EARRQTLAMTENMLTFLAACPGVRKMEFVSTVGVAGHTPGEMPETWMTPTRRFHNSYEAAKAEAEQRIRMAIDAGQPITVHRPSMVVGDARTGKTVAFQVFYHLCEFLSGARTLGMIPRVNGQRLDIIPSDYVAAALDWSSHAEDHAPSILHVCAGPRDAVRVDALIVRVRRLFRQHGRRLPPLVQLPVPLLQWLLRVARPLLPPRHARAVKALPFFLAYFKERQTFGNTISRRLLEADGIGLPSADDYLDAILGYYLKRS
ncbi:MAG: UDP-glucose 4-epimerase, partial [Desulfatitalea sp.]|nr:SDR family oxidoreductase [Desulfatitalea sp.]NNK00684.1 UDP-glucose 4-epimerase [Desulfatitalea sp.]